MRRRDGPEDLGDEALWPCVGDQPVWVKVQLHLSLVLMSFPLALIAELLGYGVFAQIILMPTMWPSYQ